MVILTLGFTVSTVLLFRCVVPRELRESVQFIAGLFRMIALSVETGMAVSTNVSQVVMVTSPWANSFVEVLAGLCCRFLLYVWKYILLPENVYFCIIIPREPSSLDVL